MTSPQQAAADNILARLPNDAKDKLRAIHRKFGRSRRAMRASAKVIKVALAQRERDARRDAKRRLDKAARAIRMAVRVRELGRPLAGMTVERRDFLLGLLTGESTIPGVKIDKASL